MMQMESTTIRDWKLAAQHFEAGRYVEAASALMAVLARDPGSAQAWLALARVDIQASGVQHAYEHAMQAARFAPDDPRLLCDIADALLTVGAVLDALACIERASSVPAIPAVQQRIALHYQNLNQHDAALAWMERARAGGLNDLPARFCLAVQLMFHARNQEAESELDACAAAQAPMGRAMVQLAQLRKQTPASNHLDLLDSQLTRVASGSEDAAALEFARYKEFEDLGRYDEAWQSLERANATMQALLQHDSESERRTFDALTRCVDGLPPRPTGGGTGDGPTPIFIVGMPRSGTTLLDRMLGNHSQVRSAGELGTFRRSLERVANRFTRPMLDEGMVERLSRIEFAEVGRLYLGNSQWQARGRPFYTDKLPRNWLLVPLIQRAIPNARILHMVRDPLDVTFSNLRSYFGADYAYCYDMNCLADHYLRYRDMVARWHAASQGAMLDVSYTNLVADPDAELRRVFAFCGLPWESDCADLARNHEPVATLSATQVRGSIRTGLSERWRHYASHLEALQMRITDCNTAAMDVRNALQD